MSGNFQSMVYRWSAFLFARHPSFRENMASIREKKQHHIKSPNKIRIHPSPPWKIYTVQWYTIASMARLSCRSKWSLLYAVGLNALHDAHGLQDQLHLGSFECVAALRWANRTSELIGRPKFSQPKTGRHMASEY